MTSTDDAADGPDVRVAQAALQPRRDEPAAPSCSTRRTASCAPTSSATCSASTTCRCSTTIDRKQVFQVHNIEQFVFLIADDPPMTCPRLDHFGLSVGAEAELDDDPRPREGVAGARRPRRDHRQEGRRPRHARDHEHLRAVPAADDDRDPVVGLQGHAARRRGARSASDRSRELRYGAFALAGLEARVHRLGRGRRVGAHRRSSRSSPSELGYHHLWVYDHVETVPRREPTHMFEAFTTLAALAQHTSTIKLGQLVTCAAYRNAGLLAKEAACVDVFSGGRLILGIGAGWYEREYQAYGFRFPSAGTRLADPRRDARGDEAALDRGDRRRSRASTCSFDGAYCDPKPIQQLPEIWIGGGGEKVTLRIEAQHADKTNWQTGIDGFVRKSRLLEQYCDEIGRDFDSIVRTHGPDCRVFDTEADLKRWLDSPGRRHRCGAGATARRVRARQLRRHRRAGRREGAGVRRRRLPRVRAVVPRLPVEREPGALRAEVVPRIDA